MTIRSTMLCLVLACGAARAQEPGAEPPLAEGVPTTTALEFQEEMRVFTYRSRPGARALRFLLSGKTDIDLAISKRRLTATEAAEARWLGYTLRPIESVRVVPDDGEAFREARTWYVHVFRAWNYEVHAAAEILVREERPGSADIGEGRVVLPLAAGGTARRTFRVPRFVQRVIVRGESTAGELRMRVRAGTRTVEGRPRGPAVEARVGRDPWAEGEEWSVTLENPSGRDARVALEISREIEPGDLAQAIGGPELRLAGPSGTLAYELGGSEEASFFLDVEPDVQAVAFVAEVEDGDFDVTVARGRPPDVVGGILHYAALGDEPVKRLHLGGEAPLPTGRYWFRVVRRSEDAGALSLSWERTGAAGALPGAPAALAAGRPAAVRFDAGQHRVGFRLPDDTPPGAHLQLIGSETDADLFVRRGDTGEILQSSAADRLDEHLRIDDAVRAPGVPLLLDVVRWQTWLPESAGSLHYHPTTRALPGASYFPPYACWEAGNAWHRVLASTVDLMLPDGGGSGILVSPGGLILTAGHVLEGGGEILVGMPGTREGRVRQCFLAEVVDRTDEELDLALLRITHDTFGRPLGTDRRLPFVPMARAGTLELGAPLSIVGYPDSTAGLSGSTLTVLRGIVSALQRQGPDLGWLVSDAPVSAGNSGGGVYDARNRLVAVILSVDTLAFARPLERVPPAWMERILAEGGESR